MHATLANAVHPVVEQGLRLFNRLERGETPSLEEEQATLLGLLGVEGGAEYAPERGPFLGGRYALACWLDDLFLLDSPWAGPWNESKIEARLYGTNDRAYRFWEQAQLAAARPTPDALEVFYICVLLGFTGDKIDDTALLANWISTTRAQLTQTRAAAWSPPPGLDPPTFVPRLTGRSALKTMVAVAAVAGLVLLPAVALLLARRGG